MAFPLAADRQPPRLAVVLLPILAVACAALLATGAVLVADQPAPNLRPTLVGLGAGAPEVELQRAATPKPVAGEPTSPIRVPADPYAPEAIQQIGTIQIPKIGLTSPLMRGVTLNNIDLGPSQWPGTAWPGQPGNSVIAGHRVTHTHPFLHIDQLVPGDQIVVTARGVTATYEVQRFFVVYPTQTDIVLPTATPTLTIFACHPPHSAKQRYVVQASLVSTVPAATT
jgi:sortase A